ncbi:hypothetical protein [Spiroplasma endosymbiont of Nephrotoma flavescens]|uniref:hypothetical protein n=1 Tax=Spiroplasma endosymbiont of Nephrotoma flavescens TaxID=3066302 RepID=UPI00313EFE73
MIKKTPLVVNIIIILFLLVGCNAFNFYDYQLSNDNDSLINYNCAFEGKNVNLKSEGLNLEDIFHRWNLDFESPSDDGDSKYMKYLATINRKKNNIAERKALQSCYNEILKVSNKSTEQYNKYKQSSLLLRDYYSSYDDLVKNLENTDLRDGQKPMLDLKLLEQKIGNDSKYLLAMYNYLSKYYGKKNVAKLLVALLVTNSFDLQTDSENTLGVTVLDWQYGYQFIALRPSIVDKDHIKSQYCNGQFSTSNVTTGIIHEYGHALENLLNFFPEQLNSNILPDKTNASDEVRLDKWFKNGLQKSTNKNQAWYKKGWKLKKTKISASQEFVRFIASKLGYLPSKIKFIDINGKIYFSNSEAKISVLVSKLFVDSNYGKFVSLKEQFAELFSQWLLQPISMPSDQLSVRWTILNEFFLEYLPNKYYEIIGTKLLA